MILNDLSPESLSRVSFINVTMRCRARLLAVVAMLALACCYAHGCCQHA